MAYIKYQCEFYSQYDNGVDSRYQINIHKKTGTGTTIPFKCTSKGFVMTMDGSDDTMLAPIKTTSVDFNFVIEDGNTDQAGIVDDILAVSGDNEGELALEIKRYTSGSWRRYWIGVILGDLGSMEDISPTNFIKIKAIDGLAQLKYKKLKPDQEGIRSLLYYIKAGLMEITTSDPTFGFWTIGSTTTENFLTHQPFYYNKGMGNISSSSWRDDNDHDPLALTKVSSLAFRDKDGQNWSYYKIIENILSTMQLRIMMTPLWDSQYSGGNRFYNGNCSWLLQAPLINHNASDNPNLDTGDQMYFIHTAQLTNDDAETDQDCVFTSYFIDDPNLGGTILTGAKEVFIPPLLNYKSVYNHKNFLGCSMGPIEVKSNWKQTTSPNGAVSSGEYHIFDFVSTTDANNAHYDLSGITEESAPGWTGYLNDRSAAQTIVITGNCELYPKMWSRVASDGAVGYDSAGDTFNYYGGSNFQDSWGNTQYGIEETATIMPRLALRLLTYVRDDDGTETLGDGNTYRTEAFWLTNIRFARLAGSTPWSMQTGTGFPVWGDPDGVFGGEDYTYPYNVYGYNGSWGGQKYWPDFPDTTSYIINNVQQWGLDSGYDDYRWWRTSSPYSTGQSPLDCRWAFFSPVFHKPTVLYINDCVAYNCDDPGSWVEWLTTNATYWGYDCQNYRHNETFILQSPRIPVGRQSDGTYGANMIRSIALFTLIGLDDCTVPVGDPYLPTPTGGAIRQRAACKSWDYSSLDTGGASVGGFGCEARGLQWDYYLSDLRVNITGVNAGVNSFDETIGWYENTNGTPSEEMVQEPEIIIGDNPPADPFAINTSGEGGFGGDFPGEFRIIQQANDMGNPEEGTDVLNWRALWEVGAGVAGDVLHKQRPKNALAHYFQMKRGLDFTMVDSTTVKCVERRLASGIIKPSNINKWEENQSGADIGYIVNGFTYVAGTGKITMTLEDCVSFNRSNLIDKTYSSNG